MDEDELDDFDFSCPEDDDRRCCALRSRHRQNGLSLSHRVRWLRVRPDQSTNLLEREKP